MVALDIMMFNLCIITVDRREPPVKRVSVFSLPHISLPPSAPRCFQDITHQFLTMFSATFNLGFILAFLRVSSFLRHVSSTSIADS